MKNTIKHMILAVLIVSASSSMAESKTSTTKTTATVANSCDFSISDVVFGAYNPTDADHKQTTQSVQIKCTRGTAYTLWTYSPMMLDWGGYRATAAMTSSETTDRLYYQIYETPYGWDDDMNSDSQNYKGTGTGSWQNLSFTYRLIKNQYVKAANYSATVTAKVTF